MSAFVTAAELRAFLDVTSTTGRASDSNLDMLIGAFVYRRLLSHDTIDEHFAARLRAIVFPQPS